MLKECGKCGLNTHVMNLTFTGELVEGLYFVPCEGRYYLQTLTTIIFTNLYVTFFGGHPECINQSNLDT